ARKHLKETMTELCQIEVDDTSTVCCHKKMN
ncbi:RNA polymerase subunit sigma-70, partial [Salmonella enterica subsp. enterica serovar London]|nr:RNA polymerase subunit sigma-70 [Salmonella enterica subsp. enterica serovar London]